MLGSTALTKETDVEQLRQQYGLTETKLVIFKTDEIELKQSSNVEAAEIMEPRIHKENEQVEIEEVNINAETEPTDYEIIEEQVTEEYYDEIKEAEEAEFEDEQQLAEYYEELEAEPEETEELQEESNDEEFDEEHSIEEESIETDLKQDMEFETSTLQENKIPSKAKNIKEKQNKKPTLEDSLIKGNPLIRHKNEANYDCHICNRKYKNPTSFRKHMQDAHNTQADIPDFICIICSKVLPTERQLKMHERTHMSLTDKLDIPCPYCPKMFSKVGVMRIHVSGQHFQEKPFVCDECGRAVKTKAALMEHKLVHTDEAPFECEVCHKRFKNRQRLKVNFIFS